MVKLEVKFGTAAKEVLYHEAPAVTPVQELISELTLKWNIRKKVFVVIENVMDLAKHGPSKISLSF